MTAAELKQHCDEIEDLAFNEREMPEGLPTQDQILFLKFRHLYRFARLSGMPQEQGKREKQKILVNYTVDCLNAEIYARTVQLWKDTESARCEVCRDEALMQNPKVRALVSAIDGIDRREEIP
nr:MAG TPA: hypothetical protein [Caudoviricetes sp.]